MSGPEPGDLHPDVEAAVRERLADSGCFDGFGEYVLFLRWWDAVETMNRHGIRLETVHADQVVCRECGKGMGTVGGPHLGGKHGMNVSEYRKKWPVAPTEPAERKGLPPAPIDF